MGYNVKFIPTEYNAKKYFCFKCVCVCVCARACVCVCVCVCVCIYTFLSILPLILSVSSVLQIFVHKFD